MCFVILQSPQHICLLVQVEYQQGRILTPGAPWLCSAPISSPDLKRFVNDANLTPGFSFTTGFKMLFFADALKIDQERFSISSDALCTMKEQGSKTLCLPPRPHPRWCQHVVFLRWDSTWLLPSRWLPQWHHPKQDGPLLQPHSNLPTRHPKPYSPGPLVRLLETSRGSELRWVLGIPKK